MVSSQKGKEKEKWQSMKSSDQKKISERRKRHLMEEEKLLPQENDGKWKKQKREEGEGMKEEGRRKKKKESVEGIVTLERRHGKEEENQCPHLCVSPFIYHHRDHLSHSVACLSGRKE